MVHQVTWNFDMKSRKKLFHVDKTLQNEELSYKIVEKERQVREVSSQVQVL